MEQKNKKTILIDLDGVLNEYKGNFNKDYISPIKSGAKEFLEELSKEYEIKIFTTRNKILTTKWLIENKIDNLVSDVTNIKDVCWLFIDDRCIKFDGNYKETINKINHFKVWYK